MKWEISEELTREKPSGVRAKYVGFLRDIYVAGLMNARMEMFTRLYNFEKKRR